MILLRHGQSEFNVHFSVDKRDPGIPDPRLTELGAEQARAAAAALAGHGLTRILASPYTRALQTAEIVAEQLDLPVSVSVLVRERCAFICDIGTPATSLARQFPRLDFSALPDIWWPAEEEPVAVAGDRAARFRQGVAAEADWDRLVVVSHWGFILAMTGIRVQNGEWLRHDPTTPSTPG
jgi:glucosyl-3-phosphoglycerate phosphatase